MNTKHNRAGRLPGRAGRWLVNALLLGASLLATPIVQAQQPKWTLGNDVIIFNPGPVNMGPATTSITNRFNTAYSDGITAATLFNVEDGYLAWNGTDIGSDGMEVAIVRVPGRCNLWYVIGTVNVNNELWLRYATVSTVTGPPQVISVAWAGQVGSVGGTGNCQGHTGIAISKLRAATNTRFLFTVGRTLYPTGLSAVNRFVISANGISARTAVTFIDNPWNYSGGFYPYYYGFSPVECELYEAPNGTMKLAWVDGQVPCNTNSPAGPLNTFVMPLTSAGAWDQSASAVAPAFALPATPSGIEFFDNGTKLLVSTFTGVSSIDLITSAITVVPGSADLKYAMIEKAKDGRYYAIANAGPLTQALRDIDVSNPSVVVMGSINVPLYGYSIFTKALPEQVDDEAYDAGTSFAGNLSAQDDNLDLATEPNGRSAAFNLSPDLWNIRSATSSNVNQHANPVVFFTKDVPPADTFNILRFRVRNTGCSASDVSYAKLYWSVNGTTANWPAAWNGSTTVAGLPVGKEITQVYAGTGTLATGSVPNQYVAGQGFLIPALAPGEEYIINAQWSVIDPVLYGTASIPANATISFLGRILENGVAPAAEASNVLAVTNATNCNDVVMRTANITVPGRLMARDNKADVGLEPYIPAPADWQIWQSPDIWNRAHDGGSAAINATHENPDFSQSAIYPMPDDPSLKSNVVRFRVKNNGNEVSAPSYAKVYWTIGSTNGEVWPFAWKAGLGQGAPYFIPGTTQVVGNEITENYTGNLLTTGSGANAVPTAAYKISGGNEMGFPIPALKPGEEYIVNARYRPLNPEANEFVGYFKDQWGQPIQNPMLCLLGRIVDELHDPMYLEHNPTTTSNLFNDNIKNNNNIVTRNAVLVNTGTAALKGAPGGSFFIGNRYGHTAPVKIRLTQAYSSNGKLYTDNGSIIVTLDDNLWAKWLEGGSEASGINIYDESEHALEIANLDNAEIRNIILAPDEDGQVGLTFMLRPDLTEQDEYHIAATQALMNEAEGDEAGLVATTCNFIVMTNDQSAEGQSDECFEGDNGDAAIAGKGVNTRTITGCKVSIAPNPANTSATILIIATEEVQAQILLADLYGKVVKVIDGGTTYTKGDHTLSFATDNIPAGTYFVVYRIGGVQRAAKLIIMH